MHNLCPCGSRKVYRLCCYPFISEKKLAPTAEALMRSRFTAFAKKKNHYLAATVAGRAKYEGNSTSAAPHITWLTLTIHAVHQGTAQDTYGEVRFTATYKEKYSGSARVQSFEEHSVFEKISGRWFYVHRFENSAES